MNGTTLRIAAAVACVAALATPGSALAAKKKHRVAHKTQQVVVPHKYDAGGDGIELTAPTPGVRVNLFDPVQLATTLGNDVLGQLGLPPLPALPTV
jgi:hypothetical protein